MVKKRTRREALGSGKIKTWVYIFHFPGLTDLGMLSATASLGWLYLWDVEDSINLIDPYVYAEDVNIQVYPQKMNFLTKRLVRFWRQV